MNFLYMKRLIDACLRILNLVRKSDAERAITAALMDAEEELKYKVEAALAIEKRQLEYEKQDLEVNWVELKAYAHATGIPLLEERPLH
jgi:hypothetical protein